MTDLLCSERCNTQSKQRDHIMCQVVASERLKTMENCTIHQPKKLLWSLIRSWSFNYERFYYRALTGDCLVFWIGGLLWEVAAYGSSTVLFLDYFISWNYEQSICVQKSRLWKNAFTVLKAHFQTKVGGWQDSNLPMLSRCPFTGCENNCKVVQTNSKCLF